MISKARNIVFHGIQQSVSGCFACLLCCKLNLVAFTGCWREESYVPFLYEECFQATWQVVVCICRAVCMHTYVLVMLRCQILMPRVVVWLSWHCWVCLVKGFGVVGCAWTHSPKVLPLIAPLMLIQNVLFFLGGKV